MSHSHARFSKSTKRLATAALILSAGWAQAQAISGLDPTTYFGARSVEKGASDFQSEHNGETYYFKSNQSKRLFDNGPKRFVPAFDGQDPTELAKGNSVMGDAKIFSVVGERVFLFATEQSRESWLKDPDGLAKRASSSTSDDVSGVTERNTSKYNTEKKLAIQGYDPVAYFPEGGSSPKKGSASRTVNVDGITYRFSSEKNRQRFLENPTRYEPSHGGWCSYAASQGSYAEIDPKKFRVEDGRLLLFYNGFLNDTKKKWEKSDTDLLPAADQFWQKESGESARHG